MKKVDFSDYLRQSEKTLRKKGITADEFDTCLKTRVKKAKTCAASCDEFALLWLAQMQVSGEMADYGVKPDIIKGLDFLQHVAQSDDHPEMKVIFADICLEVLNNFTEAKNLYTEAYTKRGDAYAQTCLAELHSFRDEGRIYNPKEANRLLQGALRKKHPYAYIVQGFWHLPGSVDFIDGNTQIAASFFDDGLEAFDGDIHPWWLYDRLLYWKGYCLCLQLESKAKPTTGLKLIREAASRGDKRALDWLLGQGLPLSSVTGKKNQTEKKKRARRRSIDKLIADISELSVRTGIPGNNGSEDTKMLMLLLDELRIRAGEKQCPKAMHLWGRYCLTNEFGVGTDQDTAQELLERAVALGNVDAMTDLAQALSGQILGFSDQSLDFQRAAKLHSMAAEGGNNYAQFRLASMLAYGEGIERDEAKAAELIDDLLAMKSPYGFYLGGALLYSGEAVYEQNHEEAWNMFSLGLEIMQNNPAYHGKWFYYMLLAWTGYCLYDGHGVSVDVVEGLRRIMEAADHGDEGARNWLGELNAKAHDKCPPVKTDMGEDKNDSKDEVSLSSREAWLIKASPESEKILGKLFPASFSSLAPVKTLDPEELSALIAPLEELIGLTEVKKQVRDLVHLVRIRQLRRNLKLPDTKMGLHMVFSGPPGTGKTVVARLMGRILAGMGFLKSGHVVEVDRNGLVDQYIGWTAKKTETKIKEALGGILFIDEAYMLTHYPESWGDVGPEVIGTLVKMMEDHRDDFVVIAAGYPEKMKKFMTANEGLRSRFGYVLDFKPYTADELALIFEHMCREHELDADPDAIELVRTLLHKKKRSGEIAISNARGVRDLFEKSLFKQSVRLSEAGLTDRADLVRLMKIDIHLPHTTDDGNVTFLKG